MQEIDIASADGVSSRLRVIGDPTRSNAVLVCFPAMGVPAAKYDSFATALWGANVAVVVAELRGIDSSSIRASRTADFGYHHCVHYDVTAAVNKARQMFPELPLYLAGHSLGGQFAALYSGQHPDTASGLILCASCTVYHKGWGFPGNILILLLTQLSALTALVMGYFPGDRLGFGGREARSLIIDWAANARSGNYRLRDTDIDYEAGMKRVNCPVLTVNFTDDRYATEQATDNLVSKLNCNDLEQVTLSAEQLKTRVADHFAWLKNPGTVAANTARWINTH